MTTERWVLLGVGCINVGAGALLAYDGLGLPVVVRAGVVVAQAIAVFILATVRSWGDAKPAPTPG